MKLYFTCPNENAVFDSVDYSLQKGHRVVVGGAGRKELQGTVSLNSGCPLCGDKHEYDVGEVMCSLNGGEND